MARKILFDMDTPPSSVGLQPAASANGLPEVPLRSMNSRRADGCQVFLVQYMTYLCGGQVGRRVVSSYG